MELASLRAGGATWLMMTCADSELVRRRGRWLAHKIMEIYIQETASLQFLPVLAKPARDKVFAALVCFREALRTAVFFRNAGITCRLWFHLFAMGKLA